MIQTAVQNAELINRFHTKNLRLSPYAYALDVTGEKTYTLIEADALSDLEFAPILPDRNWIQLQNICGG